MLHQIGKNVDGHYFKLFINELVDSFSNNDDDVRSPISFGGGKIYPENPPNYGGKNEGDEGMSNADIIKSAPPLVKDENWEYDYWKMKKNTTNNY